MTNPDPTTAPNDAAANYNVSSSDWIGAVVASAGMLYNAYQNRQNVKDQLGHEKEQAELAYQRQIEMWNKNNLYNSPEEMMKRFEDAGLNPNLIYGQSGSGNTAAPMPEYRPTSGAAYLQRQPFIDIPSTVGLLQNFKLRQAQIDNVNAQTENTEQKTVNEAIREGILQLTGSNLSAGIASKQFKLQADRKKLPYEMQVLSNQTERTGYQVKQDIQKLRGLQLDNVTKMLDQHQKRKNLTKADLDQEMLRSQILFNKYRNQWQANGITSSDHVTLRLFSRLLGASGFKIEDVPAIREKSYQNDQVLKRHHEFIERRKKRGASSTWRTESDAYGWPPSH